jgi:hypothetical protein
LIENTMPNHWRGTRWASTCAEAGLIGPCAAPMKITAITVAATSARALKARPIAAISSGELADAHGAQPHDRSGREQRQDGGDGIDDGGEDADQLGSIARSFATAGIMTPSASTQSEIIAWMASMVATGTTARFMAGRLHPVRVGLVQDRVAQDADRGDVDHDAVDVDGAQALASASA